MIYDDTYSVIYSVIYGILNEIMQNSRTSLERVWDLKICKYIEKLVHVSNKHIRSCVLLSPTSVAGQTSHFL